MSADELERLLWERIDGTIDSADAARLRRLMAGEPEAERLAAEIEALAARLDRVGEEPPPSALGDRIRGALRREAAPATGRRTGGWRLAGPPARRLVYLAAALVIAVVGYRLTTGDGERDARPFVGTAGLQEKPSTSPAVRLELPRSAGALTLSRAGAVTRVELELGPTLGPAVLLLEGSDVALENAAREGSAAFEVRPSERGLEVAVEGSGAIALDLRAGGELTVTLRSAGETLVSRRF